MKMKKVILSVFLMLLFWTTCISITNAEDVKIITKFKDISGTYLDGKNGKGLLYKVPLEELTAMMDSQLQIQVAGCEEWIEIPVIWKCLDEYENVEYGVYTFLPEPAESTYRLAEDLDVWSMPYVEVVIASEIRNYEDDMQITIQAPEKEFEIMVRAKYYPEKVMGMIEDILGIPEEQQQLYFNDMIMNIEQTLGEQGVVQDSIIELKIMEMSNPDIEDTEESVDTDLESESGDSELTEDVESEDFMDLEEETEDAGIITKEESQLKKDIKVKAVKTGDRTEWTLWLSLLGITAFYMSVAVLKNKKEKK